MSATLNSVSDASFETDVLAADGPVLVNFWAQHCPPCRVMRPIVEDVAVDYADDLRIVVMDAMTASATAERFGARNIPLLVLFEGGAMRDRTSGVLSRTQLCSFIETHRDGWR